MAKKGGDTTTQTTSSELPEYAAPYVTDLLKRAKKTSELPYQKYGNQRLADFSTDTNKSFDMIRQQAAAGTPQVDQALNTMGGIAGYQAGQFDYQGIPGADMSAYMNPYVENVLDVQKSRAQQTFAEQQAGRNAAAVQAGAFGGDRRFVQDSLATRDLNQQMQEMEATGLASAFDRATGLFQSDQDRLLRTQTSQEDANRLGRSLGLDAATQMGSLAGKRQDMQLGLAEALSGVGSKQQQRKQAGLDIAYQDFISQRDYPAQQLAMYSQLLSGTPITPTTTSTTTQPAPDFLSQLAGLAVGGAGIWDLFS